MTSSTTDYSIQTNQRRKTWIKHNNEESFTNLQLSLATDGHSPSQLSFAKKMLKQYQFDSMLGMEDTAALNSAIHWLLQSACQGIQESEDILNDLFSNGKITDQEAWVKVQKFLFMPQIEKNILVASSKLFSELSCGFTFLFMDDLLNLLAENCYLDLPINIREKPLINDDIQDMANKYYKKQIPLENEIRKSNYLTNEKSSFFHRLKDSIVIDINNFLHYLSKIISIIVNFTNSNKLFSSFLLIIIVSLIGVAFRKNLLDPYFLLFYFCFSTLVLICCSVCHRMIHFPLYKKWGRVWRLFNENLNTHYLENRFIHSNLLSIIMCCILWLPCKLLLASYFNQFSDAIFGTAFLMLFLTMYSSIFVISLWLAALLVPLHFLVSKFNTFFIDYEYSSMYLCALVLFSLIIYSFLKSIVKSEFYNGSVIFPLTLCSIWCDILYSLPTNNACAISLVFAVMALLSLRSLKLASLMAFYIVILTDSEFKSSVLVIPLLIGFIKQTDSYFSHLSFGWRISKIMVEIAIFLLTWMKINWFPICDDYMHNKTRIVPCTEN